MGRGRGIGGEDLVGYSCARGESERFGEDEGVVAVKEDCRDLRRRVSALSERR